jgi:hypothetical protein
MAGELDLGALGELLDLPKPPKPKPLDRGTPQNDSKSAETQEAEGGSRKE